MHESNKVLNRQYDFYLLLANARWEHMVFPSEDQPKSWQLRQHSYTSEKILIADKPLISWCLSFPMCKGG